MRGLRVYGAERSQVIYEDIRMWYKDLFAVFSVRRETVRRALLTDVEFREGPRTQIPAAHGRPQHGAARAGSAPAQKVHVGVVANDAETMQLRDPNQEIRVQPHQQTFTGAVDHGAV